MGTLNLVTEFEFLLAFITLLVVAWLLDFLPDRPRAIIMNIIWAIAFVAVPVLYAFHLMGFV